MRRWLAPCLMAAAAVASFAQTSVPAAQTPAMQVLKDADVHLTFSYPADLQPVDAASVADTTGNSRFGADSDANADTTQPGTCGKVLLSVGKVAQGSHGKIWGTLTLIEVGPSCLPPKVLKSRKAMDALLKPLVTGGTTVLGMMPLGTESVYLIQGNRVHFVAAQGQPVTKSDLQPAEQMQTVAHMAVAIDNHIVLWKVESNNASLLNHILASQVDFGEGAPQPLFPGRLQNDLQF